MIIQGSNTPIYLYFPQPPADIHVTLRNEIEVLKEWTMADLSSVSDTHYQAPISQEESLAWEPGNCWIEVKWSVSAQDESSDIKGLVQFAKQSDRIIQWTDNTILTDTIDVPEVGE